MTYLAIYGLIGVGFSLASIPIQGMMFPKTTLPKHALAAFLNLIAWPLSLVMAFKK